jgi:hypothetical protein
MIQNTIINLCVGIWVDSDGNKSCDDASVEGEFEFHNVGTISGTLLQWYNSNTFLNASAHR